MAVPENTPAFGQQDRIGPALTDARHFVVQGLWLAGIVALAAALRLIRLGTFPYWHDEVHNLVAAEDVYGLLVKGNLISNHPPLPYLLVAGWRLLGFDAGEWTMRLLPALFGVLTVVALYAFVRHVFDERTARIAAALLAVSPLHVHHSQDLKEYIYLPFVATLMILFLYRAVRSNHWRDWLAYGTLAGIGCYTEIFVGPLLVAINLWVMGERWIFRSIPATQAACTRSMFRRWVAANGLGALLFLPWLRLMVVKAEATMIRAETWWIPPPSLGGVAAYIKAIAFGYTAPEPWYELATLAFALLSLAGIRAIGQRNPPAARLIVMWAVIPVAIVYAISMVTESIFLIRAMLPYALAAYVLVAAAIAELNPPRVRRAAVTGMAALASLGLWHHYGRIYTPLDFPHRPGIHPPRDYDASAAFILDRWQDGDVVVHAASATWFPFFWYGFREKPQYVAGLSQKFIRDVTIGNPRNTEDPAIQNLWPQELQTVVNGANRVWYVYSEWERKYLPGNAMDIWRWLDAHYSETQRESFRGIEVRLYARPQDAVPVERDHDDGVSAEITYRSTGVPHLKVVPDDGILPRSLDARRGRLRLRFSEPTGEPDVRLEQTTVSRLVAFTLENTSDWEVSADVCLLPSDGLIEGASLYEKDAADEVWHVYAQHNPLPPPPHFEYPVAVAHHLVAGTGTLEGTFSMPEGIYRMYSLVLGVPGNLGQSRSDLDVAVNGLSIVNQGAFVSEDKFEWRWIEIGEVVIREGGVQRIRVNSEATGSALPAFQDIAYFAFIKNRGGSTAASVNDVATRRWPGRVTLGAGESRTWVASIDAECERSDVWALEYAEDGRVYRIFRMRN